MVRPMSGLAALGERDETVWSPYLAAAGLNAQPVTLSSCHCP